MSGHAGASTSGGRSARKRKQVARDDYDVSGEYEEDDNDLCGAITDAERASHRGAKHPSVQQTADNAAARQRGQDKLARLWFNAANNGGRVHDLERHKFPGMSTTLPAGDVAAAEPATLMSDSPVPFVIEHAAPLPAALREQARSILYKIDAQQGWSKARKVRGGLLHGLHRAVHRLHARSAPPACMHAVRINCACILERTQRAGHQQLEFKQIHDYGVEGIDFLYDLHDHLASLGLVPAAGTMGAVDLGAGGRAIKRGEDIAFQYNISDVFGKAQEANSNPMHQDVFSGLAAFNDRADLVSAHGHEPA
jgi:hypothetical protein